MAGIDQNVVVITGAGSGLGLGMAERFARAGADVILAERDPAPGHAAVDRLRADGYRASFELLDVSVMVQSRALVDKVVQEHGRLDTWINSAELARLGAAELLAQQDWDDSIATLLSGTFYCCQAAGRYMLTQGRGVIINVASVTGLMHEQGRAAYSTAKAGVIALTEALGIEWAKRGVRVVGIAPGLVKTEGVPPTLDASSGAPTAWERRAPMRRLGTLEEVAEAALFLSSPAASYIVGETLRVDGGWAAYQLF